MRSNIDEASITVSRESGSQSAFGDGPRERDITARGNFAQTLVPGKYVITVNAQGYFEEQREIYLDRPRTVVIRLLPRTARVRIMIPDSYFLKGREDRRRIRLYDNGRLLRGGPVWDLPPGRHLLRMEAGPIVLTGRFFFEAGGEYTVEPFMGLRLNE